MYNTGSPPGWNRTTVLARLDHELAEYRRLDPVTQKQFNQRRLLPKEYTMALLHYFERHGHLPDEKFSGRGVEVIAAT